MSPDPEDFARWKQLLETADLIEQLRRGGGRLSPHELEDILETARARLEDQSDPVEHFEFYVVSRLCRALADAVSAF